MHAAQQEIRIRERAYAIWEQEGRPEGREWDHWIRAASEIAGHNGTAQPINAEAASVNARNARKSNGARGKMRQPIKSAMS
jgi:hypothetical protein